MTIKSPSILSIGRASAILVGVGILAYVFNGYFAPLGAKIVYMSNQSTPQSISMIGPSDRVSYDNFIAAQHYDLAYFTVPLPYSNAVVDSQVTFKSSSKDTVVKLGYRDMATWHYNLKTINAPFMNNLNWSVIGSDTQLYQKEKKYKSVTNFLNNLPTDKIIGTFDDQSIAKHQDANKLNDYIASNDDTVIDTPIRGTATFYVYLKNEPLRLNLRKHDLNWYEDADTVSVKVEHENKVVYQTLLPDDGDTSSDRKSSTNDFTLSSNSLNNLSEGVYKVTLEAQDDVITEQIITNANKIVFVGPIWLASSQEEYGDDIKKSTNQIYSKASKFTVETRHDISLQTVHTQNEEINLSESHKVYNFQTTSPFIDIPKSDVIINGIDYMSFSKDQYFDPFKYHIVEVDKAEDLSNVDYVLTSYHPPVRLSDSWIQSTTRFNLNDAVPSRTKLSWLINSPGIYDEKQTLYIKSISITLYKEGWL